MTRLRVVNKYNNNNNTILPYFEQLSRFKNINKLNLILYDISTFSKETVVRYLQLIGVKCKQLTHFVLSITTSDKSNAIPLFEIIGKYFPLLTHLTIICDYISDRIENMKTCKA